MPTYYIDFEGGNDANAGTSFATRWKTFTNGATSARIAPGDTIRVMASPDPTSIGNATWTDGPRGAVITINSSSNATPIVITASAAHGLVTGDYVSIGSHTTNTNANGVWRVGTVPSTTTFQILKIDGTNTTGNGVGGATGAFSKATNCMLKLPSALTQNIALFGGLPDKPVWTASTDVTTAQNITQYKEGYSSAQIAIAAAFTTGKAAYFTLPSTLNLSGYQQVSFWVLQTAGTLGAAGAVYLALCSDTIGNTVVDTINLPALGGTNVWQVITVNLGTNLGSSIQSVALYVATDNGAQTFLVDNIIACKAASSADSLNLTSLISKSNGTGDEAWYAIQSINSDVIMLANNNANISTSSNIRGYMGTTETITTYKRETIKITPAPSSTVNVNIINDSGISITNLITFSGGWDRTNMSTQTGETWYDGQNGNGYGFGGGTFVNYYRTDKLNATRYAIGWRVAPASQYGAQIGSGRFTACTNAIATTGSTGNNFDNVWVNNNTIGASLAGNTGTFISKVTNASNNTQFGLSVNESLCNFTEILQAHNNGGNGIAFNRSRHIVGSIIANSNAGPGISAGTNSNIIIGGGSTAGNGTSAVSVTSGDIYLNNFTINEVQEVSGFGLPQFNGPSVYATRLDNTDNNSWVFAYNGTVNQQTAVVDSPATTAWKLSPTIAGSSIANTPVKLKLGTVVCAAGSLVTVTARMRRDSVSLTMQLVCPNGQILGVASDVISNMTAAANTWETVTITFTPTKAGAVDIYAYAFGGTTLSGYVCNLTASQA